ncbi:MAG: efflux RND transporter periplasmic adaptor subunit [Gemmatimonadota bacterium]
MSPRSKVVLAVLVILFLSAVTAVGVARARGGETEVRAEEVVERDLTAVITATGSVRARRQVNVSSDIMGRVIELNVDEGDEVERGRVLLRLDPSQTQAAVARARAALSRARSQVAQQQANLIQAQRDLQRVRQLRDRDPDLVSVQRLQDAETQVDVQRALMEAAEHGVEQAEADLQEAEEQLSRTTIRSPISGRVTRLEIEEGETVVVGTMNSPGSLLLTVSDLSTIEAVLSVDETNVPRVSLGDSASVELDAFPERSFSGRVSRVGNSALRPSSAQGSQTGGSSVDFEVVLTLDDPPADLRPDLSATAEIVVESRTGVTAVPIIAVTTREGEGGSDPEGEDRSDTAREGVFVIRDGAVRFQEVELGITGRDYFAVRSGIAPGDSVVAGPFRVIQELDDGTRVRTTPEPAAS